MGNGEKENRRQKEGAEGKQDELGSIGELIKDQRDLMESLPDQPSEVSQKTIVFTFEGKKYDVSLKTKKETKAYKLLDYFSKEIKKGAPNLGEDFIPKLGAVKNFYSNSDRIQIKIAEIEAILNQKESILSPQVKVDKKNSILKEEGEVNETQESNEVVNEIRFTFDGKDYIFNAEEQKALEALTDIEMRIHTLIFAEDSIADELENISKEIYGNFPQTSQPTEKLQSIIDYYNLYFSGRPEDYNVRRGQFLKLRGEDLRMARENTEDMAKGGNGNGARDEFRDPEWFNADFQRMLIFDETLARLEDEEQTSDKVYRGIIKNIVFFIKTPFDQWDQRKRDVYKRYYLGWNTEDFLALLEALKVKIDHFGITETHSAQEDDKSPASLEIIQNVAKEIIELEEKNPDLYKFVMEGIIELRTSENSEISKDLEGMMNQFFIGWQVPDDFKTLLEEIKKLEAEKGDQKMTDQEKKEQEAIKIRIKKELDEEYINEKQNILTLSEIEAMNDRLNRLINESGLEEEGEKAKFRERIEKMVKVATWKRKKYDDAMALKDDEFNEFVDKVTRNIAVLAENDDEIRQMGVHSAMTLMRAFKEERESREIEHAKKPNIELKEKPQKEVIKIKEIGPYSELKDLLDQGKAKEMLGDIIIGLSINRPDNTIFSINQKLMKQALDKINDPKKTDKQKKKELMDFLVDNNDEEDNFAESFIKLAKKLKK